MPSERRVPIIAFVNRSSSASRPYDVRFWKIAWQMPKPEQILYVRRLSCVSIHADGQEQLGDRWLPMAPHHAVGRVPGTWRLAVSVLRSFMVARSSPQDYCRESVPLLLSQGFSVVYEILDPMPSWLLTLVGSSSGVLQTSKSHAADLSSQLSMGVGFVLIGFLHSGNSAQTQASRPAAPPSQRSGRPRQKPSSST